MSQLCIALVGPSFFSYIEAIRDEIASRGIPCVFHDERHSNGVLSKIAYRLQLRWLIRRNRDRHLAVIQSQIIAAGISDVILIDVEVVTLSFVEQLRSHGIRVHIYMWDSAHNKRSFLDLLPLMEGRGSFEQEDCARYGMTYIPLFAEAMFKCYGESQPRRRNQIVFLGTLHSRRAELLREVERLLNGSVLSVRGLLYYHSRWLFVLKSLSRPWTLRYLGRIRTTAYDKDEIANTYFVSKAVLDIHHPGQAGLTSRTFEALRSGTWLVTLNSTVDSLPEELRARVILIKSVRELERCLPDLERELPPLSAEADYFLSLERFTTELLGMAGLPSVSTRRRM